MRVSSLVVGFPDHSLDNVLQAVSNLRSLGYVSLHDSLPQHISLNKKMKKEVLRIVDPFACIASPSTGQISNEITANTSNNQKDRIKGKEGSSRSEPIAITRITPSMILIGSIIVMTMSLFGSSMTSRFDQSSHISFYSPLSSPSINRIQTLNLSPYEQEVSLNSFALAKGSYPLKDTSVSNLIILVDKPNAFHRIIIDIGANPPNMIYLKNASLVLNI